MRPACDARISQLSHSQDPMGGCPQWTTVLCQPDKLKFRMLNEGLNLNATQLQIPQREDPEESPHSCVGISPDVAGSALQLWQQALRG